MSKTRNQRRRAMWRMIERIILVVFLAILVWAIITLSKDIREIEAMQQERREREQVMVVRAEDFLPDYFDQGAYEAACQRYDIERGYIIPEQKETAPEAATSEAGDTENSAS